MMTETNMTECPSCGALNRDEAIYCRSCGSRLQDKVYVRPKESWGIVHIGIILFSVILLITSFGLIMGGSSIRTIQNILVDEDGFLTSDPAEIDISSYALVLEDMEFDIDPVTWRWFQNRGGLLTFKIVTESNDPSKEIFVGIAQEQDVKSYLDDVEYQRIQDTNFDLEDYDLTLSDSDFMLHQGGAPSATPLVHSYWVVQSSDADQQEITWDPQAGNYYVVIMNADASEGIHVNVQVGVRVPFFGSLGNILLTAGLFVGAIGVLLVYFTLKRSQP
jgi:hypothetical protein